MQAPGGLSPPPTSIVDALSEISRQNPTAIALTWRDSAWTYAQLLDGIAAVRSRLASCDPYARVAILMRNSPQYAAAYYGALAANCVAVPLNAQERAGVLSRQVEHSGATVLIGDPAHKEWAPLLELLPSDVDVVAITPSPERDAPSQFHREVAGPSRSTRPGPSDRDGLAVILYTSGTTGRPKGVMLSHGNVLSNALAIVRYLRLTSAERGLCVLPLHFSYGSSVLNSHLVCGATLLLEDNLAYPHVMLERIQTNAVTGFAGVPSTFALLLGRCQLKDYNLESLRYITQAGGAMPRSTIERLRAMTPGIEIYIMYGQTEATARLSWLPPDRLNDKLGSVGVPIADVEIDLRDEHGSSLPPYITGEIVARGPNVMLGYWRDPEATERVLRDGWLHTGDLGHRDTEGYLYIDGRAVEMIKTGAFRVSPQEVEEVIAALDGVQEVGVTAIGDDLLGQAIVAVIIPTSGANLDARTVKAQCHRQLAAYKVPREVRFVTEFPRTSSGKIQRLELAKQVNA